MLELALPPRGTRRRADARLRQDFIGAHCECYYSGVVSTFPYSGRSVARQKLLATLLCLDSTAPLGVGHFGAPGLLLAKSGFGGLNNINSEPSVHVCVGAELARRVHTGFM